MANTKHNKQYVRSEEKILQAGMSLINKDKLEKISVGKICSLAKVNRSTFYAHFVDIFDLVDRITQKLRLELIDSYKRNDIMESGVMPFSKASIRIFVEFIGRHQEFYKNAVMNDQLFPIDHYASYYQKVFSQLKSMEKRPTEEEMLYYLSGFQGSLTMIIRRWINQGCVESSEYITNIIVACVPDVWMKMTERFYCE